MRLIHLKFWGRGNKNRVSLIAGLEYGMENEKWNGMVIVHSDI